MKVKDILAPRPEGIFIDDKIMKSDVVGIDAMTGHILFDTRKNKEEYVAQYMNGEISSMWASFRCNDGLGYSEYITPIVKCFIHHDSWKESEER